MTGCIEPPAPVSVASNNTSTMVTDMGDGGTVGLDMKELGCLEGERVVDGKCRPACLDDEGAFCGEAFRVTLDTGGGLVDPGSFGLDFDVSAGLLAVGAPYAGVSPSGGEERHGVVQLFRRDGAGWKHEETLSSAVSVLPGEKGQFFGESLSLEPSLDGSLVLEVGAPGVDRDSTGGVLVDTGALVRFTCDERCEQGALFVNDQAIQLGLNVVRSGKWRAVADQSRAYVVQDDGEERQTSAVMGAVSISSGKIPWLVEFDKSSGWVMTYPSTSLNSEVSKTWPRAVIEPKGELLPVGRGSVALTQARGGRAAMLLPVSEQALSVVVLYNVEGSFGDERASASFVQQEFERKRVVLKTRLNSGPFGVPQVRFDDVGNVWVLGVGKEGRLTFEVYDLGEEDVPTDTLRKRVALPLEFVPRELSVAGEMRPYVPRFLPVGYDATERIAKRVLVSTSTGQSGGVVVGYDVTLME